MVQEATLILLMFTGEPIVKSVPWPVCLAIHRDWRYADANGKNYIAMNTLTGVRSHVREVRCEDRNDAPKEVPTS